MNEVTKTICITPQALHLILLLALLNDRRHGGVECMGILAGPPGCNLIDTVILAPEQTVTAVSVTVSPQAVLEIGRELERLHKEAKGWWHSHGRLPPFHSGADDTNSRHLLAQIGYLNRHFLDTPLTLAGFGNGGRIYLNGREGQLVELEGIEPTLALSLADAPFTARLRQPVESVVSLVVNARGDAPYAERLTRHACSFCGVEHLHQERVELAVVPTPPTAVPAATPTPADLEAQIARSVRVTAIPPAETLQPTPLTPPLTRWQRRRLWLRVGQQLAAHWARQRRQP